MTHRTPPDDFRDLVEAYCDDLIRDDDLHRLEARLTGDAQARQDFVEAFHLHTELHFAVRARCATSALGRAFASETTPRPSSSKTGRWQWPTRYRIAMGSLAAALVLLTLSTAARFLGSSRPDLPPSPGPSPPSRPGGNVAWLVNAQDCVWDGTDAGMPGRDMRAGRTPSPPRPRRARARPRCRVLLQGPAELELISSNEARLISGALTARVPPGPAASRCTRRGAG